MSGLNRGFRWSMVAGFPVSLTQLSVHSCPSCRSLHTHWMTRFPCLRSGSVDWTRVIKFFFCTEVGYSGSSMEVIFLLGTRLGDDIGSGEPGSELSTLESVVLLSPWIKELGWEMLQAACTTYPAHICFWYGVEYLTGHDPLSVGTTGHSYHMLQVWLCPLGPPARLITNLTLG